jgi:Ca2+-binding RTX toxin-like protein
MSQTGLATVFNVEGTGVGDILYGAAGNDTLTSPGDDTLRPRGNDTIDAGAGDDDIFYTTGDAPTSD